jgi:hypothetical protein
VTNGIRIRYGGMPRCRRRLCGAAAVLALAGVAVPLLVGLPTAGEAAGQIGDGTSTDRYAPVLVPGVSGPNAPPSRGPQPQFCTS